MDYFFCYAVEGKGLRVLILKGFCFSDPVAALYYKNYRYHYFVFVRKVKSGVNAVQIFDSWAVCSPVDYQEFMETSTKSSMP
jgi:uroporphyrinogen-III decarboxylase